MRGAFRPARQDPTTALTAVLTLGLALAMCAAMFAIVRGVLLRPLPYQRAEELVRVWETHEGATPAFAGALLSNLTRDAWLAGPHRTVEDVAAYSLGARTLGFEAAERVTGASVSPSLFTLLRVSPALGRLLVADDAVPGKDDVVVLSEGLWRERFGADPSVIGGTLRIDARPHVIVGVAPAQLVFPQPTVRFWTPFVTANAGSAGDPPRVQVFAALARVRAGATPEQVSAEATAASRAAGPRPRVATLIFGQGGPVLVQARALLDDVTWQVKPALRVAVVAVGFVLLIGCANVANLLLAREIDRQRDRAVRASLGASSWWLLRQSLVESLLVSWTGGALGVGLAWVLVRVFPAVAPQGFPRLEEIEFDPALVLVAFGLSALAGAIVVAPQVLRNRDIDLVARLRSGGGRSTWSGRRTRRVLLGVEAALGVMLLVMAGLMGRSFAALAAVDAGYDPARVLVASFHRPGADNPYVYDLLTRVVERVRALSGVEAAGVGNMVPFAPGTALASFDFPPRAGGEGVTARAVTYGVTDGYAEALRLRCREGRLFAAPDATATLRPMLVNEEFVRRYLDDGGPVLGRRFDDILGFDGQTEIVGVVANVLKDGLDRSAQPEMYFPLHVANAGGFLHLVVRTTKDPALLAPAVRAIVRDLDPEAALDEVGALEARLDRSIGQPRFVAAVLTVFAGLALILAGTGLYGALAYSLGQRRRELGIRSALGAAPRQLAGLMVREALGVVGPGAALGLVAVVALGPLLDALLFGVTSRDALTLGLAPLVLAAVSAVACAVPARHAARVDTVGALRVE